MEGTNQMMPNIDDVMRFEDGQMDHDEAYVFLKSLVDSGVIFQLQGFYGRAARDMGLLP